MSLKKFNYGKDKLTYQIAIKIANKNIETEIGLDQLEKIDASRKNVESIVGSILFWKTCNCFLLLHNMLLIPPLFFPFY